MRALAAALVLAACSGPAKPVAPVAPPTKPVTAIADLHGSWQATDLDGWTYEMKLDAGTFTQTIGRTAGGPCAQRGTLQSFETMYGQPYKPEIFGGKAGTDDGAFALIVQLEENACNPDYRGVQLVTIATEFTGDAVTLRTMAGGWGGPQETRRYTRVVSPAPAP